jgi:hypothetical protein
MLTVVAAGRKAEKALKLTVHPFEHRPRGNVAAGRKAEKALKRGRSPTVDVTLPWRLTPGNRATTYEVR